MPNTQRPARLLPRGKVLPFWMGTERKSLLDRVSQGLSEQISRTTLDAAVRSPDAGKRPKNRATNAIVLLLILVAAFTTYFLAGSEDDAVAATPAPVLERMGGPVMSAQEKAAKFIERFRETQAVPLNRMSVATHRLVTQARRMATTDPSSALLLATLALDLSPRDPTAGRLKRALERGINLDFQSFLELRSDHLGPMLSHVYRDDYVVHIKEPSAINIDFSREIFGRGDAVIITDAGGSPGPGNVESEPAPTQLPPGVLEAAAQSPNQ